MKVCWDGGAADVGQSCPTPVGRPPVCLFPEGQLSHDAVEDKLNAAYFTGVAPGTSLPVRSL